MFNRGGGQCFPTAADDAGPPPDWRGAFAAQGSFCIKICCKTRRFMGICPLTSALKCDNIPSSSSEYRLIEARTPCVPRGKARQPPRGRGAGRRRCTGLPGPPSWAMRTVGPRPGSRSRGRGAAAEGEGACLGPQPGPWENIPRTVTNVERYQFSAPFCGRRVCLLQALQCGAPVFLWSGGTLAERK